MNRGRGDALPFFLREGYCLHTHQILIKLRGSLRIDRIQSFSRLVVPVSLDVIRHCRAKQLAPRHSGAPLSFFLSTKDTKRH